MVRADLPETGARVLDVGSGHGDNALALKRAGYDVVAIELQGNLVRAFTSVSRLLGIRLMRGDATRLPLADAICDGAVLIEVLEHLEDPSTVLREIRRVLRTGGHLWVALPTGYTEAVYSRLHPQYSRNAGHVRRYQAAEVEELLRASGFTVIRRETRNLVPALQWFVHALLRSRSDDTGRIHQHRWVDWVILGLMAPFRLTPGVRRLYFLLSRHVGKSWYFHCAAV